MVDGALNTGRHNKAPCEEGAKRADKANVTEVGWLLPVQVLPAALATRLHRPGALGSVPLQ